jgi:hypothetical protein
MMLFCLTAFGPQPTTAKQTIVHKAQPVIAAASPTPNSSDWMLDSSSPGNLIKKPAEAEWIEKN